MKAYRQHQKTQGYAGLRNQLGFTQEMMALQLGISRSMLCRVECGNRKLPLSALVKMAALQKCLLEQNSQDALNSRPSIVLLQTQETPVNTTKNALLTKTDEAAIYMHQYELKQMQHRHQQLKENLQQLQLLARAVSAGSITVTPALLEMQRCNLLQKIKRCDEMAQQKLQIKIAAINARIAMPQTKDFIIVSARPVFSDGLLCSQHLQELSHSSSLPEPTLLPLQYGIFDANGMQEYRTRHLVVKAHSKPGQSLVKAHYSPSAMLQCCST